MILCKIFLQCSVSAILPQFTKMKSERGVCVCVRVYEGVCVCRVIITGLTIFRYFVCVFF